MNAWITASVSMALLCSVGFPLPLSPIFNCVWEVNAINPFTGGISLTALPHRLKSYADKNKPMYNKSDNKKDESDVLKLPYNIEVICQSAPPLLNGDTTAGNVILIIMPQPYSLFMSFSATSPSHGILYKLRFIYFFYFFFFNLDNLRLNS